MVEFTNLARHFDLLRKGSAAIGISYWESIFESHRDDAMKGEVDVGWIVENIHYDYEHNQDGKTACRLFIEALVKDLHALKDTKLCEK